MRKAFQFIIPVVILSLCTATAWAQETSPALATILVSVELEISSPTIGCAPTSVSLQCAEGSGVSTSTLLVWNATPPAALDYAIATTPTWLSCAPTTGSSTGSVTTHTVLVDPTWLNADEYAGMVTITAPEASDDPATIPVTLEVSNVLPTAAIEGITPNSALPPLETVVFEARGDDAAGLITAQEWRSTLDGLLSSQEDFGRSSNELTVGVHTITFAVWDDEQTSSSDAATLTVLNAPPNATIVSIVPDLVPVGLTVTVTVEAQDNDEMGQSLSDGELTWPGQLFTGLLPGSHEVTAPYVGGNHVVEYRVKDDEGAWSAASSATLSVIRPEFVITWPTTGTVWQPGTWGDLTFTVANLPFPSEVFVELWRADGSKVGPLRRTACQEGHNTAPEYLPASLPVGRYRIRLFWVENVAVNVWGGMFMTASTEAKRWTLYR